MIQALFLLQSLLAEVARVFQVFHEVVVLCRRTYESLWVLVYINIRIIHDNQCFFVLATLLVHFAHILVQRNHFNNIIELLKSDPTSGFIYHLAKTNLFKIFLNRFHSDFVSPFIQ